MKTLVGSKVVITRKDSSFTEKRGEVIRESNGIFEVYFPHIGGSWCFERSEFCVSFYA